MPSWVPDGTTLKSVARAYSDMFDNDDSDNLLTEKTTVSAWADLEVEKTQHFFFYVTSKTVIYTIVITNLGPSDARGVIISDTVPVEILGVSWDCCAAGGAQCKLPFGDVCTEPACPVPGLLTDKLDIPAGARVVYTVQGTMTGCTALANTVEVIAPESAAHPGRDIDTCHANSSSVVTNRALCTFVPLAVKNLDTTDSD